MQNQTDELKQSSPHTISKWIQVLKILLAVILIGVVFSKTSLIQIAVALSGASRAWLILSFVMFGLMTILKSLQYFILFGNQANFLQVLRIVIIQNALSNIVANTAGIASFFTMFRVEQNVDLKRTGAVFAITKISDLFSMGLYLLVAAYLVWNRIESLHQLTLFLLGGVAAGFIVFFAIIIFRMKFVGLIRWAVQLSHFERIKFVRSGLDFIQLLAEQDRMVFVRTFLKTAFFSLVYITATMIYVFCRVRVFHIPIDLAASLYTTSLFQFISMIPIQIFGGIGVVEVTSLYLYSVLGIVAFDIPAAMIGGRLLTYLFHIILLIYVFLTSLIKKSSRHDSTPAGDYPK